MSEAGPDAPDEEPDEPRGTLRPTSARALTASIVVGLALGWAIHPVMTSVAGTAAAGVVGAGPGAGDGRRDHGLPRLAHVADRARAGERLEPHQAVNRLVLARACALAGAAVTAGYVGYAVSWLGDESQYADRWILRSLVAAAGAAGVTLASLALERACRADGGLPRA